jgi:DNA-binding CsgD family transcriptional regulator
VVLAAQPAARLLGDGTNDFSAVAARLVPDADYAVGIITSLLEPIDIVARSPHLRMGLARRFLHYGLAEAHRSATSRSFVVEPLSEGSYTALLACVFADSRLVALVGYVRRLRAFGPAEVTALREALPSMEAAAQRRGAVSHPGAAAAHRIVPALCVLNPDLTVEEASASARELTAGGRGVRIPPEVEARVRAAIADWGTDIDNCAPKVTPLDDGRHILRIFPLSTGAGLRIGLLREPVRRETALLRAVERYGLTLREVQILNLLAGGCSSGEIAHRLGIAESTVNEHIMRMMQKTETTNRVELIATTMVTSER